MAKRPKMIHSVRGTPKKSGGNQSTPKIIGKALSDRIHVGQRAKTPKRPQSRPNPFGGGKKRGGG